MILWVCISRLLAERFVRDKKILEKRIWLFIWREFAFFRNNLVIICEIIYTICKLSRSEMRCMESAVKILYTPEEQARQEIRNFVNEGLKDVQENALYDFEDVFDELESRYKVERV